MRFTGKNLVMVRDGIRLALAEIHNQIATCPDVFYYANNIEALEDEQAEYEALLARVELAVAKEEVARLQRDHDEMLSRASLVNGESHEARG